MYERIKYPDGQISVKADKIDSYVKYRINSYEDLFYIKSVASLIKSKKTLYIPCMFGQRSDRQFLPNQSFDLKIITEFINSMNFDTVTVFDPHSDVTIALLNNSEKESSFNFVAQAINHIKKQIQHTYMYKPEKRAELLLVSPDAGAYKKVFEYGEKLNLPVVAAVKHRSLEGEISLKFMGDVKDKECLIVDDLCDGGYTFLKLAESLREQGANKVYLYISHGYFSKGFSALKQIIDHIYCTNSVMDIPERYSDGLDIVDTTKFLTQYKII